ncbi:hypothetical protein [Natrinema halophilum]|uniref:hypothetical protein n=1 Tax=Natrinema halophilum TaxID=1699371 RepID=UPI001F4090C1|nr:hypothetical protein [Natrinema halophilum]UHQ96414.1 hypothetical protein HYG82_23525 [Natrinema halophilum]
MTDLSQFGGGIDRPEIEDEDDSDSETDSSNRPYANVRCRGITTEGRRCAAPASNMWGGESLCGVHSGSNSSVTIDSDPISLIEATSRKLFMNLGDLDVDEELIRGAIHNIHGLEERPLPVYEAGLWLPEQFAKARRLIIRTPTSTIDPRLGGSKSRHRIFSAVRAGQWDPDYLEGEGRTAKIRNEECLPGEDGTPRVGLKIAGEEQRWFPVEINRGDQQ